MTVCCVFEFYSLDTSHTLVLIKCDHGGPNKSTVDNSSKTAIKLILVIYGADSFTDTTTIYRADTHSPILRTKILYREL